MTGQGTLPGLPTVKRDHGPRVLICGGRDFADLGNMREQMGAFCERYGRPSLIIIGGARGADALAEQWASQNRVPKKIYPADWDRHGRSAGMIRNRAMLNDGKPDFVIGFPGGRGTENMLMIARSVGVAVLTSKDLIGRAALKGGVQ